MKLVHTVAELREEVAQAKAQGLTIGLVPTMGALHEGHASLISAANKENDFVVVSVFVTKSEMTLTDVNLDEWTKYDGNNFYYAVKPQIDELFVRYPEEKTLNDAVANSKWVHVGADSDYYVVGVLFNDDEPSFICYGVPSASKQSPPSELENACVWLPIGNTGSGYWVIYQSARTGEIVK